MIGEIRDETWRAKNRPDNLFGSAVVEDNMACYALEGEKSFAPKVVRVKMNHALMQIVREMVMNCTDLVEKDPDFRKIKIDFDADSGSITIRNDGRGIPIGKDLIGIEDEARKAALADLWSPTLLLARWGCSSNYDDSKVRFTAGKNGLGAKAVLAWCDRVEVRAFDSLRKRTFAQTWTNGMRDESPAVVKETGSSPSSPKKGFTEIKLWPSYSTLVKLDLPLSPTQVAALRWCAWECSTVLPAKSNYGITIDGYTLPDHSTEGMVKAVMAMASPPPPTIDIEDEDEGEGKGEGESATSSSRSPAAAASRSPPKSVIVRVDVSWGEGESITGFAFPLEGSPSLLPLGFVNGVPCPKGTHRQRWESALVTEIKNKIKGKAESSLTKGSIMNHLFVVTAARINQPKFSSQTKDELVTRIPPSVSMCDPSISTKLQRAGFINFLKSMVKLKENDDAEKSLISTLKVTPSRNPRNSRRHDVDDVEHYEGAELAGRIRPCFLFLTEGLSAQNCARNVIARLTGDVKRKCGSYALRGKLINAMSNPAAKVWANKEVQSLVKICNLNPSLAYESEAELSTLRYHKLVLWTDADTDGGHIAWLVFLLIYKTWPHLAKTGFLQRFVTPLLKIQLGNSEHQQFYSEAARDRWLSSFGGEGHVARMGMETDDMLRRRLDSLVISKGCKVKYFKGLGRLMAEDEKDLATRFEDLRIGIVARGDADVELVQAIGSDDSDQRRMVQSTRRIAALPYDDLDSVSISEFVDGELLPYMRDANLRQIPGIDGFIEVTRMIMAYFFVKPGAADPKAEHGVARLAAAIAAELDYHHGETSMAGAIATMAQDFAGKNNMNLLQPRGQFGTRAEPTPAAPRYTNTALHPYASILFPREDYSALPMPRHGEVPCHMPGIVPILLINGASGIGYGHSTFIPSHHPRHVFQACLDWIGMHRSLSAHTSMSKLEDFDMDAAFLDKGTLKPWIRGLSLQPTQSEISENKFETKGKFQISGNKLVITELPAGTWTKSYCAQLSKVPWLCGVFMHPKITSVHIEADIVDEKMVPAEEDKLMKALRLVDNISYTNMKCFDCKGNIRSFANTAEIIHDFAQLRIWIYARRKELVLENLQSQLLVAQGRMAFIQLQLDGKLDLKACPDSESVHEALQMHGVLQVNGSYAYLESLRMFDITQDQVRKKKVEVEKKQAEIDALAGKTPFDMWEEELVAAMESLFGSNLWREHAAEDLQSADLTSSSPSRKRGRK